MTVRELFDADLHLLGSAKVTVSTATTTAFDFGTPNDLNMPAVSALKRGDRVFAVFTATTTGTTDTVSFVVQDADDSSGSIGTPATAVTDGTLTGGTGTQYAHTAIKMQAGRPWLRLAAKSTGATDTFVCTVQVYGLGAAA